MSEFIRDIAVILVRPQLAVNIGACARAMGNFGLHDLRLVAPRDGWPQDGAAEMAAHSASIIERAQIFPTLAEALHDITTSYAATARRRELNKRVVEPRGMAQEIGEGAALIFGPENSGLNSDDLALATHLVTIPVHPGNPSLNIAQSVAVLAYECFLARQSGGFKRELEPPAPQAELSGMFNQLEEYLDAVDYWREPNKKPLMWRNLQNLFARNQLTSQEVKSLRGLFRSVWERRITP